MNAMSVDVEDYFQVSAFDPYVDRSRWSDYECRIPANMDRILEAFDAAGVKGTFFFLGWVAEQYPSLLRQVVELGHEIGSHGYSHVQVFKQNEDEFRQDVSRTKKLLEDLSGAPVDGYRAASFSIGQETPWAYRVLAEAGHRYSSSVFPIRHDRYGMRDAPRFPHKVHDGALTEIPVTTVELSGARLPCGGGGYFRLLPYFWTRWAIRRVNRRDAQPANFYFHPWEVDPAQPRMAGSDRVSKFRHYVNLDAMAGKLDRLYTDFPWTTVRDAFASHLD
jgi:polysaccharide deacetylase family protein (PEP-CTERM system associated)